MIMYNGVKRTTKRGQFLADMEKIVPYAVWVKIIEPYYVKCADGLSVKLMV